VNEARADDRARWWFLTTKGFENFKNDPVAQGYEIISRHPGFNRPKKTWQELDANQKDAFYFAFKEDLRRMGLAKIAFIGPKAVTFDCRESAKSILTGIHYAIRAEIQRDPKLCKYFPIVDKKDAQNWSADYPTRLDRNKLSWAWVKNEKTGFENQDVVTIDWHELIDFLLKRSRRGEAVRFSVDHILSAVETLLTKDKVYCRHAKRQRKAHDRNKSRPKRFYPSVIALGCVAHDWHLAKRKPSELMAVVKNELHNLKIQSTPRWDNHRKALEKIHNERIGLKKPVVGTNAGVIDVLGTNYPHLKKKLLTFLG
jgi:hypothetical protein